MATTIVTKSGSGAPTASDLVAGELAVDLTNKRLYTEDSGGTVLELGTNPASDVTFGDSTKAIFGDGSDLQIYHDGSHSYIKDAGDGQLRLLAGTNVQIWNSDATSLAANFNGDTQTSLYYAGAAKLATSATGIDVTGTVTADRAAVYSGVLSEQSQIRFGYSSDYHWSMGRENASTGDLFIESSTTGTDTTRLKIASNGDISFYEDTGTTPKFVWDASAESLGIGTTDLNGLKTVIKGSTGYPATTGTTQTGVLRLSGGTGLYNVLDMGVNESTDSAWIQATRANSLGTYDDLLLNPNGGNVGIGTSSSFFTASGRASLSVNGTSSSILAFGKGGSSENYILADAGGLTIANTSATLPTAFFNNGSTRMTIDSSGNAGIGVVPSAWHASWKALQIGPIGFVGSYQAGTTDITALGSNVYSDGAYKYIETDEAVIYKQQNGTHIFDVAPSGTANAAISWTTAMTIDNSGKILIGDSASHTDDLLQIETPASGGGHGIQIRRNDSNTDQGVGSITFGNNTATDLASISAKTDGATDNGALLFNTSVSGGANTERMRIDASGNLLVGTASTAYENSNGTAISVAQGYVIQNHVLGTGTGTKYTYFSYNAGEIGSITQNGTTAVLYNTTSDQRLKENIADADDAGSKIDAIQVRKFDWKADGSHQDYGMVAQELLEVAPEAVAAPEDPEDMMGVDYSKLVPMMLKEIQSLRARIAALES